MNTTDERRPDAWDAEVDVVIAGAGGAGLESALEAAAAGANTIVFEKQTRIWESSTAIAVGRICFTGTDQQKRCGIEDSYDLLYRDIMQAGKHKNAPALVQAYVEHQLDTYRQLCSFGIAWSPTVNAMAGMSVPRGHLTDPLNLVTTLKREAQSLGVPVLCNTPVTGLIADGTNGVVGVTIQERTGAKPRIRARRGVVLASGGFARNPARLRAIDPRFGDVVATSGPGHTGDGLAMAEELGADSCDLEYVQPSFELHANGTTTDDILVLYYQGAIVVNAQGERFVNESMSYKDIAKACLDEPERMGFQVFDSAVYEKAVAAQAAAGQSSPMTLDASRIRLLVKGQTIEELAHNAGIPPQPLRQTVERYNQFVAEGRDADFGRNTLAGNYGKPQRVDRAPFYAYATIGHLLATYGGIAVDANMRVLSRGRAIPGFYAAGEAVGGFHGAGYHTGTALGKALIFGRIAGRSAAMRGLGN